MPTLPAAFPTEMPENAGNMIHGNAPFEMFPKAVYYKDRRFGRGRENFVEFVNRECSHLVVTLANLIKLNDEDGKKYATFQRYLENFDVPIVIFGLGAQAPSSELDGTLPPEAVDLMKYLGDRTSLVGVRGDFTASVFERFARVTNTLVTGCPSFFSRPQSFAHLADALRTGRKGRVAYNGTTYHDSVESDMLVRVIQEDNHLIEPVNKYATIYARGLQRADEEVVIPWFLKRAVKDGRLSHSVIERFFSSRFHLFRDPESWYTFNSENVGFSYGTRFHVNMASILSGVPAMWVTHDSRTEELTRVLRLPAIPKEEAVRLSSADIHAMTDYRPMFENLEQLFSTFNRYLEVHKLPSITAPNVSSPYAAKA